MGMPTTGKIVDQPMPGHDIIVVGASAGGMEALTLLAQRLPAHLPAAVFVVWHLSPQALGILPRELQKAGPLPAANAIDGEEIQCGRIYVAPPDRHLTLEPGRVRVTHGPKENGFRPAVDPLFPSAALAYGSRVVGVILSGSLDDGTAGLSAVKVRGGVAVVQDPDEAQFRSMPDSALNQVKIDHRLPVAQIGPFLGWLAREPAGPVDAQEPEELAVETRRPAKQRAK
jgi:two-component system, chemotaxis family, protein-glutamate methylesterase/glutaminase